jgi:hypothetical protein
MTDVRWMVLRDRHPFRVGEELGPVMAPDKATALERGAALYGGRVVVRAALSLEVERREKPIPLDPEFSAGGRPVGARRRKKGSGSRPGVGDPLSPRPQLEATLTNPDRER